jgi:hypothetical protein
MPAQMPHIRKADPVSWARNRLPVTLESDTAKLTAYSVPDVKMALRKMYLNGSVSVQMLTDGGEPSPFTLNDYASTAHIVPPTGPVRPAMAFIGLHPSPIDAARGEPFSGPDGHCLLERYLKPLNLAKSDALLTYVTPAVCYAPQESIEWVGWVQNELASRQPHLTVALGKQAKEALGELADFVLPHPSAIRKSDNDEQLLRRLKAVQGRRASLLRELAQVHISKADGEKRIVYGVVLDPYQYDTQGDWIPAMDIETSAHEYMENSRVVGLQHAAVADAVVLESWLWPYPSTEDYNKAMRNEPHKAFAAKFGSDVVHSWAWVMGTKVYNIKTWEDIKAGRITAYSIGGVGVRSPADAQRVAMPAVEFIDV